MSVKQNGRKSNCIVVEIGSQPPLLALETLEHKLICRYSSPKILTLI